MPDYGDIALIDETVTTLDVPALGGRSDGAQRDATPRSGPLHLISVPGMARPHPYLDADGRGWADNDERFFRFSRAIAAFVEADPPDILHLNDWHTGAALGRPRIAAAEPSCRFTTSPTRGWPGPNGST